MTKFARYKTVSEESTSIMGHNYYTMLINSVVIPMIVVFKFKDIVFSYLIYRYTLGNVV